MERRRAPRVGCNLPCDLTIGRKSFEGTVLNISQGGLAVEAPLAAAAEGDSLSLTLKASERALMHLTAIVWNTRTVRRKHLPGPTCRLGLVSEADEDATSFPAVEDQLNPCADRESYYLRTIRK